ncbi:unnamed protein product [Staurois parvus]|uniref:Uncharacterized protein n=1 Tax=Staurois parvus TaxID=386267 RepID=A0ABN9GUP9_9NEOB|nr:unnamed protein product [Staurois parvus]
MRGSGSQDIVNAGSSGRRYSVPHRWCRVRRGYSAPALVSCGGIVPIVGVSGRNSAPSLVSVGGIVPHRWCQWEE